jgi:hypothetical protein
VLCALSRGTRAVSVRRVLDSHVRLAFAEDGVLVTSLVTVSVSSDVWAVMEAV